MLRLFRVSLTVTMLFIVASWTSPATAEIPNLLAWQGVALDSLDAPLADGDYNIHFAIYNDPTAGDSLWGESHLVTIQNGVINVLLGTVVPVPDSVFAGPSTFLQVQFESEDPYVPRSQILSVGYAFRVGTINGATGGSISGPLTVDNEIHSTSGGIRFPDNSVQTTAATGGGGGGGWVDDGTVVRLETASDNVGIGLADPSEKLDVVGNIHASGSLISGNSITIDGTNDRITASSGTLELNIQHLTVLGKASIGTGHVNTGTKSFVAGEDNTVRGTASTVSGGSLNTADASWATVSGGVSNVASGFRSTIGGGQGNGASDDAATVAGGLGNSASNVGSAVGGGINNKAEGSSATVGGGTNNVAASQNSVVAGGAGDSASAPYATVSGGISNIASQIGATVGGGGIGRASGQYATVAGGFTNLASFDAATASGGHNNSANGPSSTVGGGGYNIAQGSYSVVGGGGGPAASDSNSATGITSTIAGGRRNTASALNTTVSGGSDNIASGLRATVGGGQNNTASMINSTVSGGTTNTASGIDATVAGGNSGTASGTGAMVPGGVFNTASGLYSFAAGRQAKALHDGAFVWADNEGADIASVVANQFVVRAGGGIWLGRTSSPTATAGRFIETSTGGYLSSGGTWTNSSDKNLKENFVAVDRQELLEKISTLSISQWNYKAESDAVKHIGPTAQDFFEHFGLGDDDKAISTIDPAGIALAAIQELYRKTKEIDELRAELEELRSMIERAFNEDAEANPSHALLTAPADATPSSVNGER